MKEKGLDIYMDKDHNHYFKKEKKMINQEEKKSKEIIQKLFESTFLSGFRFNTNFTLEFSREITSHYEHIILPQHFSITILTDWWFGLQKDWMIKVNNLNNLNNNNAIEPEEPVQAFELASLRWSDSPEVRKVQFNEKCMTLVFANGKKISILCESDEDYAWIIEENSFPRNNSKWSAVCEDRKIYVETNED